MPDIRTYGLVIRKAIGGIFPWNFRLTLAANEVAPAIEAANCVVLKPSGFGKEHGLEAFYQYPEQKSVVYGTLEK